MTLPQPVESAAGVPEVPRVALLGNPNTGKTTLFNRLCGLRARTANFPGTTVDARIGRWPLADGPLELVDLPGTYRLQLELPEADVCRRILDGGLPTSAAGAQPPQAAVVVVDATSLPRNLCLVGEVLALGLPTVVALNMVDLAQRRGLSLDVEALAQRLGCPVVPIGARKGTGLDDLRRAVVEALNRPASPSPSPVALAPPDPESIEDWVDEVLASQRQLSATQDGSATEHGGEAAALDRFTARLDRAFTHPLLGLGAFVVVMGGLFWTVFSLATLPMDLIEVIFEGLGGWIGERMPEGAVRDLLVDGVVGGVAGTVVFLPQICLLFFLISLLEDTGYLARAAFVMDRVLCRFGLPGHAFVPLLSSHACALPGILSTRLIPDRQDRLATILVAPFMSCSARLPVYVLLTGMLFDDALSAGLAFAGCYLLGALAALFSAALFRRSLLTGRSRPMVLELPSYKAPSLRTAILNALHQGRTFLEKAGTMIVAICIVMWWLSAYPTSEPPAAANDLRQQAALWEDSTDAAQIEQAQEWILEAEHLENKHAQSQSYAGRLGRLAEPVFAPLGYDWQLTVGVLTSFLAREVFVSTMAVLLVGDPDLADDEQGVIDKVRRAQRDDGSPLFNRATAASLMVFFVLAMQCLPTLALTRKEAGGMRWAALQLAWMSGLAWLAAFATYHGMHWLGFA